MKNFLNSHCSRATSSLQDEFMLYLVILPIPKEIRCIIWQLAISVVINMPVEEKHIFPGIVSVASEVCGGDLGWGLVVEEVAVSHVCHRSRLFDIDLAVSPITVDSHDRAFSVTGLINCFKTFLIGADTDPVSD